MESKTFYGQAMKLAIVDIQKHKLSAEEAIFFEMDILIQMMRALTQDNVKCISMEVSAMSVEQGIKIGETFFGNNILECITTRNYWDVGNEYKPLMHMWYVGVIMQFYVLYPLLYLLCRKLSNNKTEKTIFFYGLVCITILSLCMYLFVGTAAEHFYYLPYRLFEFGLGGLVVYASEKIKVQNSANSVILCLLYAIVLFLFFTNNEIISNQVKLFATILASTGPLILLPATNKNLERITSLKPLAVIGQCSYSIFVWHQVVLAFARYSFIESIDFTAFVYIVLIVGVLSYLSYRYIEKLRLTCNFPCETIQRFCLV